MQVSAADYGKRYLGTIVKNASGYGEDSKTGRLLWNEYNRVERPLLSKLTSGTTQAGNMSKWVPYFYDNAPAVRLLVPNPETSFELTATGISTQITEDDAAASRAAMVGIGRDMNMVTFDDNTSCVPIWTHSYGNTPMNVSIRNYDSGFRGYHKYTLAFYTNYNKQASGLTFSAIGAGPGLHGAIYG